MPRSGPKPAEWRRWVGIGLRTAHIASVALLAAQVLGAGAVARHGALFTFVTGLALLASELADRRVALGELAGLVVVAKLALVGVMVWRPALAPQLFWWVLAVSAVISHAPKGLRHWRPVR